MASRAALAATRSLDILSFLAANPGQAYSLTELARALEVNPSSMFAIVNAMTDAGYLSRHTFQKTYRLGVVTAAVGLAARHQDPLLEMATDEIRRLAEELDIESVVVAAVGGDMVTLACAGPTTGRFLSFIGQRAPYAAPVGSIFAAWADDERAEAWLERTEPALDDKARKDYRKVLDVVRREGHAVVTLVDRSWRFAAAPVNATPSRNRLLVPLSPGSTHRVHYVGVPVFDVQGNVELGLFAAGTSTRMTVDRVNQLADGLHDAAAGIMNRVGAKKPAAAGSKPRRSRAR